jgi:hypothetical protein
LDYCSADKGSEKQGASARLLAEHPLAVSGWPTDHAATNLWQFMSRNECILAVSLVAGAALNALGNLAGTSPASEVAPWGPTLVGSAWQRVAVLAPLAPAQLEEIKRQNSRDNQARLQIGVERRLESALVVNPQTTPASQWTPLANGWRVWAAAITSQGALGLRLHVESATLPDGVRLLVYDPAHPPTEARAITAANVAGGGEVWTETVFADKVVLECQAPPGAELGQLQFSITGVSHLFSLALGPGMAKGGSCHNDVTCYPAWASEAKGVARMAYVANGNTYVCTGCLLSGSDPATMVNYFLTANHCVGNQVLASTIELFWFYQTTNCNGIPPDLNSVPHTVGGADLLATSTVNDFTFLRIRQAPPTGVFYLAWSTNQPATNETLTCIHHPTGAYKRITFGNLVGSDLDFWGVQWTSGVTEDGSSGSPLLNANHQIIGQLNGGFEGPGSSCSNPSAPDQFGRFDVTYKTIKRWLGTNGVTGSSNQVVIAKGTYNGLFFDYANGVTQQSSGFFTLTTTAKGRFSGRLQVGAARYALSGQFASTGMALVTIPRRGLTPLSVQLQVDPADSDSISGAVSDGTWTAQLDGDRAIFDGRTIIPTQAGQYTLTIPASSDSSMGPGGDSYGSVTVDRLGRVHFSGTLADNTRVSQVIPISKAGQWPLYVPLYSGGQGSVLSWISFDSTATSDLGGALNWIKPAMPRVRYYAGGFTNQVTAAGSRFVRPARGQNVLSLTQANASLSGGNLNQAVTNQISIGLNNRVTNLSSNRLVLAFSTTSGLFSGRVLNPATSRWIAFTGVVSQKQNVASGFFLGTNQSSEVFIGP